MTPTSSEPMAQAASRPWRKRMLLSGAPVALMLALHLLHLFIVPTLAGTLQMEARHGMNGHDMSGHGMSGMSMSEGKLAAGSDWFPVVSLLVNLFGMGYAVRMLWMTRKANKRDLPANVCRVFSVAALAFSLWMICSSSS